MTTATDQAKIARLETEVGSLRSRLAAAQRTPLAPGTPFGISSPESANRTLNNSDNGKNLICTGSLTFTVNTGLMSGFGCCFKGTVAFTGTATVTDVRTTGSTNPWCALCQTGANTYDVVGAKA
jgi:hypothetical protein